MYKTSSILFLIICALSSLDAQPIETLKAIHRVSELNCAACHQGSESHTLLTGMQAPALLNVGERISPTYLERFLNDPAGTKPGTTMPDALAALPESERKSAATSLAHYLISESKNAHKRAPIDKTLVKKGDALFHSVGCVACHNPRDREGTETALPDSKPLGDLKGKYSVDSLAEFLKDPLAVRPAGLMPDMNLLPPESRAIAHYLLQGQSDVPPFKPSRSLAKKGRQLYESLNCAQCHDPSNAEATFTSVDKLDSSKGCLSSKSGNWPRYSLTSDDRKAVNLALRTKPSALTNEQSIQMAMIRHNCTACHERGGLGGVSEARQGFFKTTQPNLGVHGQIPPDLNQVGARLNDTWLRSVLLGGKKARPYMNTRMPRFGEKSMGQLADLFEKTDTLPPIPELPELDKKIRREYRKQGEQLVGINFACYTCHTFKGKAGGDIKGLDLYTTVNRLEKDYFYHFMMNPQTFKSGIIMPSFFPGGRSPYHDIFEGDGRKQIEAMWEFLSGDFYYSPKGLVAEKALVDGRDKEAVILRRKFSGLGTHRRGISVAYPHGINLAFNAQEADLFAIWKGEFLDATAAFTRQGEGAVAPRGEHKLNFPSGPSVWSLKKGEHWPQDNVQELGYRFRGYQLDKQKRPTFRYDYNDIRIEDFFLDVDTGSGPYFVRTLTLFSKVATEGLYLRVARGKAPEKQTDSHYRIDDKLDIRTDGVGPGELIDADEKMQDLIFPVGAFKGEKVIHIEYRWGELK